MMIALVAEVTAFLNVFCNQPIPGLPGIHEDWLGPREFDLRRKRYPIR
jgi:hypothetical protein